MHEGWSLKCLNSKNPSCHPLKTYRSLCLEAGVPTRLRAYNPASVLWVMLPWSLDRAWCLYFCPFLSVLSLSAIKSQAFDMGQDWPGHCGLLDKISQTVTKGHSKDISLHWMKLHLWETAFLSRLSEDTFQQGGLADWRGWTVNTPHAILLWSLFAQNILLTSMSPVSPQQHWKSSHRCVPSGPSDL
jgi:hypothetical protein